MGGILARTHSSMKRVYIHIEQASLNLICTYIYIIVCFVYASEDLYGGDQTISVSIGSEEELKRKQKVC